MTSFSPGLLPRRIVLLLAAFAALSCRTGSNPDIPVTGIVISPESIELEVGQSSSLQAVISPDNASDKTIQWKSSNESVATVNDGVVTAVEQGSSTVTATSRKSGVSASCSVQVRKRTVPVRGISLDRTSLSLLSGEQATLVVSFTPADATNRNIIWSVSDNSVAQVASGKVSAVAKGTCKVKATSEDGGFSAECTVIVSNVAGEIPGTSWGE